MSYPVIGHDGLSSEISYVILREITMCYPLRGLKDLSSERSK